MNDYSPREERLNILSHAFGFVMSIMGLLLLVLRSVPSGNPTIIISSSIFGVSMILLYAASTFYHRETEPARRARLKIIDHATIYVLIAGTYTPFTLITLSEGIGLIIFSISWGMALVGIILKLFFIGKYKLISTLMYVFMGWMIVFAIQPLIDSLDPEGMQWLIAGGLAYTVGAIFYSIKKISFNHAIFHLFVLIGTFCHFISIYNYVVPSN